MVALMICAAALATLDIYAREDLFARVLSLESLWGDAVHALRGLPHVADIRTLGLVGAIDLDPNAGGPGKRGFDALNEAFHRQDLLIRTAGDTLVLAPPLVVVAPLLLHVHGSMDAFDALIHARQRQV
jgi:beta-alanine--pyruvate transaminase